MRDEDKQAIVKRMGPGWRAGRGDRIAADETDTIEIVLCGGKFRAQLLFGLLCADADDPASAVTRLEAMAYTHATGARQSADYASETARRITASLRGMTR